MAEQKKVRIREAKVRDVGLFTKLWKAYLESNEKVGSVICPNERNMAGPTILFERYVSGDLRGVVLFVADYAVFMAGEQTLPLEYNCGRVANLWGSHVLPSHEVGPQLVNEGLKRLKEKGFNTLLFTCVADHGLENMLPNPKPIFVTVKAPLE